MFLIETFSKIKKSPEDLTAIHAYLSQLKGFQAPYEIIHELSNLMQYRYIEQGSHIQQVDIAYYILKGELCTENGQQFRSEMWYDLEVSFTALSDLHCVTLPLAEYHKYKQQYGEAYQRKKRKLFELVPSLDKINSSRLQDSLLKMFQEQQLGCNIFINKMNEQCSYFYILVSGKLSVSKTYQKQLSQQERSIMPKKMWQSEIYICEINDNALIGEELLNSDTALYNIKIISKYAIFYVISITQLRTFPPQTLNQISRAQKEKNISREEIFQKKALDIEKSWKNSDKNELLTNEIKKTISFKVLKQVVQTNKKQDQCSQSDLSEFQRIGSPIKQQNPNFIQQYFKQRQANQSNKNPDKISLQQFIQKQHKYHNPYSLFEQVYDPMEYANNDKKYKRQQFSVFIKSGLVNVKSPEMPKQVRRPPTSDQTNERIQITSFHTPKPISLNIKRQYRSQSAHKPDGLSILGGQGTVSQSIFYLRSNSSQLVKFKKEARSEFV